jgi:hypothetical protein
MITGLSIQTGTQGTVPISVPEGCTLPTVEQPFRLDEFETLFRDHLVSVERRNAGSLRMTFAGANIEARVRDLSERESRCCSFFGFTIASERERVVLDVDVAPAYAPVLAALENWAAASATPGRPAT